ncbi:hypothetical protein pdam_00014991 [Pocillopora damicornis]|uniref:Structural maintenance of chromosomes protein 5 n=1 Tax=Pocillopora damicornis TaxID=46731 RepID=A0A3M6T5K7_POCDA|nr:hypothetical protein pdam_00014991 [Pocillopora damicornis]
MQKTHFAGNFTKMASKRPNSSQRGYFDLIKRGKSAAAGQSNEEDENASFVDGSIVRVKMRNFVTYADCEFKPGPHLNVLLGPNGMFRHPAVRDFIKHGASQAMIEIELHNSNERNHIITREMYRNENRSNWKINGKGSTMKEVQELTKKLNVQVANLCQFLPQDKVQEFAKMSQQQLLEATEKAVGSPKMFDSHQKLIELRKQEKELEVSLRNDKEHLEKLEQQNERLEHEVKRHQERERHLQKVQILEKKRPWAMEKGSEVLKRAKSKSEQIEKKGDKIEELRTELKDLKEEEKKRQKRMNDLERVIDGLRNELDNLPDPYHLQPRIDEINVEARQKNREVVTMQGQARSIRDEADSLKAQVQDIRSRISELEDMKNRRLEHLRNRYKDTYNAVLWLRANQHKFHAPIHEPILLQASCAPIA